MLHILYKRWHVCSCQQFLGIIRPRHTFVRTGPSFQLNVNYFLMLYSNATFSWQWYSFASRMKYFLSVNVLLCFHLHLSQAAVEHNPGIGREEGFCLEYPSHGGSQDAICTGETWREIMQCKKDLLPLVKNGFPWGLADISEIPRAKSEISTSTVVTSEIPWIR